MALLDEITDPMVALALTFPGRGYVWTPENGQIVYKKFIGSFLLNKNTDGSCNPTDDYCVGNTHYNNVVELQNNCIWLPSPNEIRDAAIAKGGLSFLSLFKSGPNNWTADYVSVMAAGSTPWEAEFNIYHQYILGIC